MVAEAFLMRGAMAMALLLLLGLCSVSLSAASALPIDGLNQKSLDFTSGHLRHRSLLQATPPRTPPAPAPAPRTPPAPAPAPRTPPAPAPAPRTPPAPAPAPRTPPAPAPAPRAVAPAPAPTVPPSPPRTSKASPTPARVYLMWIGIGAFILVLASAAVFCLCRKFGQNKISRGQRLPPLPRYH